MRILKKSILKKKITYKDKPYMVIINECINVGDDYIYTYYEVKIRKPYHIISEYKTIFNMGTSYIEMIRETFYEYIKEQKLINKELSEIDKIKEWDGVINEL